MSGTSILPFCTSRGRRVIAESLVGGAIDQSTLRGYALLREGCGCFPLEDSALIELRGEDRKAWLQAQATNDLRSLGPGGSMQFCLCSATGQLLATATVWAFEDRFLIVCPKGALPALMQRIEMMVIMEDVEAKDLTVSMFGYSVQGPEASAQLSQFIDLPTLDAGLTTLNGAEVLCLRSNRTGLGGWDLYGPSSESLAELLAHFEPVPTQSVEIARIEAGIPKFGEDTNEKTLPPELGVDFESKNISYRKGCYVGQEVLMRIHSRGHTNKTWVGLLLDGPVIPKAIVHSPGVGQVGVVTSVAESPRYGHVAAATVRNEAVADGEPVTVEVDGVEVKGEVVLMPILRSA